MRVCVGVLAMVLAAAAGARAEGVAAAQQQVTEAERAFAKTMAERDHAAFTAFLAEDAVFMGERETLRGRDRVSAGWKRFYEGAQAPFSWEPERVEVLDGGGLALSTGPVRAPDGTRIGTFSSVWRRDPDGRWRVVFDKGCPPCPCTAP